MSASTEISLNKNRLEALSDGVFAIVMTLLVIEIKVPEVHHPDSTSLINSLIGYAPLFASYFITFAIMSVLWLSHHFLLHSWAKNVDRVMVQINVIFLSFLALIPFSSHFLGLYFDQPIAVLVFGLNLMLTYLAIIALQLYIIKADHIENPVMPHRFRVQGKIRQAMNIGFTFLGILVGFFNTWVAVLFFLIPVIFNAIPGLLNKFEKLLGLEIK
jgi:uncharacterized membrane protein